MCMYKSNFVCASDSVVLRAEALFEAHLAANDSAQALQARETILSEAFTNLFFISPLPPNSTD